MRSVRPRATWPPCTGRWCAFCMGLAGTRALRSRRGAYDTPLPLALQMHACGRLKAGESRSSTVSHAGEACRSVISLTPIRVLPLGGGTGSALASARGGELVVTPLAPNARTQQFVTNPVGPQAAGFKTSRASRAPKNARTNPTATKPAGSQAAGRKASRASKAPTEDEDELVLGPTLIDSPAGDLRKLLAWVRLAPIGVIWDGSCFPYAVF
mmetsp:Transcript_40411/g.99828  ORF Transcript_40411/g.99828 Transcript_40411/m.99828 type:complete len:212 (+) Transcript_40411:499-1134(+)